MKIERNMLSLAGEYAVASELCRRGLYAQITFGNYKSVDIVIFDSKYENYIRVEVKSKQVSSWSNIKGIKGKNSLLICVDFYNKENFQRPDFYIFTEEDWLYFMKNKYEQNLLKDGSDKQKLFIDEDNAPCWINQKVKGSKSCFKGIDFKPKEIIDYQDKWEKILNLLK